MIKFKQKDFSILSSTLRGAGIGAAIGMGSRGPLFRNATDKIASKIKFGNQSEDQKKLDDLYKQLNNIDAQIKKRDADSRFARSDNSNNKSENKIRLEAAYKKADLEKKRTKINNEINNLKNKIKSDNIDDPNLKIIGSLTILGAAMGFLVGVGKEVHNKFKSANKRLMGDILDSLGRKGFKEGKDFTRDPKIANSLKTKVCIVISKDSDDLSLRINYVNDNKLKNTSSKLIKSLPKSLTVTENMADKYNDISITTISKSSEDVKLITDILESFIRAGFPVYLIEVG